MSIEPNLFELQSTPNVRAGLDDETMDFVLNLEVLRDCVHSCPGCFVNRRNSITDINLDAALALATDMDAAGLRFREVIISPTDIFSASNAVEILEDETFQQLLRIHPKTRITTTAMFHKVDWEQWDAVFAVLDDPSKYKPDMIIELLVPLDIDLLLSGDDQYYSDFSKALYYLKHETPKIVDWSFVVNVHHDNQMIAQYDEVTKIVKEQFDTVIEFLPSFFRTGNDKLITAHLQTWKEFLQATITPDNYQDMMLTIADPDHNAVNTIVVNYKKNKMSISPFIYEQIVFDYPSMETGITATEVMDTVARLTKEQFEYVTKTTECSSCPYLTTCVGRNVLSFMEAKDITKCIYPKDILNMYHNNYTSSTSARITRCANNN